MAWLASPTAAESWLVPGDDDTPDWQGDNVFSDSGSGSDRATGQPLATGEFLWQSSAPLVAPEPGRADPCHAIKDPSIVFSRGRWHLFCTIRSRGRTHQVEYLSFTDWAEADRAARHVLTNHAGDFCAPQVFYFEPQKTWYMICQASNEAWEPQYGAAFATNADVGDPNGWSALEPMGHRPADGKAGLDFWVICDDDRAHLFFTTLDGCLWREQTTLDAFPRGWSEPQLAVRADIFEAAHVYRLGERGQYLAVVEAQHGRGWRYQTAFLAERLEGPWRPLAASKEKAFASMANVEQPAGARWTDSVSHVALLRAGHDQNMIVDPADLRIIFQGVLDKDRKGKGYGDIPWRLGLLRLAPASRAAGDD